MPPTEEAMGGAGKSPMMPTEQRRPRGSSLPGGALADDPSPSPPPSDRLLAVYLVFATMGLCMLFPYMAFVTASHYFYARLVGTRFEGSFEALFALTFQCSNTLALLILTLRPSLQRWVLLRGHRGPIWRESVRVLAPLVVYVGLFSLVAYCVARDVPSPVRLFWITTGCLLAIGAATALLQGGVYGLAGRFPPLYTQAVLGGQGVAGLTAALASLASQAAQPAGDAAAPQLEDVRSAALSYFVASIAIVAAGALGFGLLTLLPFAHYHATKGGGDSALTPRGSVDSLEPSLAHAATNPVAVPAANGASVAGSLVYERDPWWGPRVDSLHSSTGEVDDAEHGGSIDRGGASGRNGDRCGGSGSVGAIDGDGGAGEGGRFRMGGSRRYRRLTGLGFGRTFSTDHIVSMGLGAGSRVSSLSSLQGADQLVSRTPSATSIADATLSPGGDEGGGDRDTEIDERSRLIDDAMGSNGLDAKTGSAGGERTPTRNRSPPPSPRGVRSPSWLPALATIPGTPSRPGTYTDASTTADVNGKGSAGNYNSWRRLRQLARLVAPNATAVFLTFFGTMTIFPAVLASVTSGRGEGAPRALGDLFAPLLFVIFNAGDTIGRLLAALHAKRAPSGKALVAASVLRLALVPAFLLCNVDGAGEGSTGSALPTPLAAPIFPLVLAGALGLSNGFIGSLAMMHAPRRAPQRSRDEAGGLMALFLVSGCAAGALAGLGLQALACGCNPLAQKDAR